MRFQGKITRWDDDRGFGFIAGNEAEDSVFVHIKAFPGTLRRPEVGDVVTYEIAQGQNGKTRAENVRFAGQTESPKQSAGRRRNGRWPVIVVSLFACFLVISAALSRLPWIVVGAYGVMSLVTFAAYGWDKFSARRGKWRTPESTLHLMGLAGGWPGALVAQSLLRHKSSKQKFLLVLWGTVTLNVVALSYLVWSGDANFINTIFLLLQE